MNVILYSAPTSEPISLSELKSQLRLDSESIADSNELFTCIVAGSHPVVTAYTLLGTAIEVIGKKSIVFLQPINNGTGATVDCKIQESDDNIAWTDWKIDNVVQAFAQITEANDTVIQEKEYTGSKRYIRTVAKTLVLACEFGTSILTNAATTAEDALLTSIIQSAREMVEDETRRALMTQTFDLYLDRFPVKNYITIPFGNLQSVTHIKYTDSTGTETTMAVTTDYTVETNGEKCGRVVLPYNGTWPTATLKPSNPIVVRFVCGWAAANLIPAKIKQAILMIAHDLWSNRSAQDLIMTNSQAYVINTTVQKLLWNAKLWEEL
jgi:uncharacterized phiE125 gp8 family phage protein